VAQGTRHRSYSKPRKDRRPFSRVWRRPGPRIIAATMSLSFTSDKGSFEERWIVYAFLRDCVQHHLEGGTPSSKFSALHKVSEALGGAFQPRNYANAKTPGHRIRRRGRRAAPSNTNCRLGPSGRRAGNLQRRNDPEWQPRSVQRPGQRRHESILVADVDEHWRGFVVFSSSQVSSQKNDVEEVAVGLVRPSKKLRCGQKATAPALPK